MILTPYGYPKITADVNDYWTVTHQFQKYDWTIITLIGHGITRQRALEDLWRIAEDRRMGEYDFLENLGNTIWNILEVFRRIHQWLNNNSRL